MALIGMFAVATALQMWAANVLLNLAGLRNPLSPSATYKILIGSQHLQMQVCQSVPHQLQECILCTVLNRADRCIVWQSDTGFST